MLLFRSGRLSFFRGLDDLLFGALDVAWQHLRTLLSANGANPRIGQFGVAEFG
jgi:hypothetical protein